MVGKGREVSPPLPECPCLPSHFLRDLLLGVLSAVLCFGLKPPRKPVVGRPPGEGGGFS